MVMWGITFLLRLGFCVYLCLFVCVCAFMCPPGSQILIFNILRNTIPLPLTCRLAHLCDVEKQVAGQLLAGQAGRVDPEEVPRPGLPHLCARVVSEYVRIIRL